MNMQREEVDEKQLLDLMSVQEKMLENSDKKHPLFADVTSISQELIFSPKPLVILGGGAVDNDLLEPFLKLLNRLEIPYATSLKGAEKVAENTAYLGMIGSYGTRVSNYAIQECEFLLVIGSRLDVRQTGSDCNDFARKAKKVVQIDIDEHQLNNRIKATQSVVMDSRAFFEAFIHRAEEQEINQLAVPKNRAWFDLLSNKKAEHYTNEYKEFQLNPFNIFHMINEKFKNINVQFVCDVGNNQMWAAHTLRLSSTQKMHHSGGLGAMGFSIPTSLGVQVASQVPVISFSGDGGAQLNIQELDVISREKLPILTIVLNNKALGMVKNFQEMYFDGRDESTYWKRYSCNFVQIAKGYHMESYRIESILELGTALDIFISNPRPILLEIDIEFMNECRPRLSFGDKLDGQSPRIEQE